MSTLIDNLRPVADIVAEYDHSVEPAERRALVQLRALGMTPLASESLLIVASDDAEPVAALEAAPVSETVPEPETAPEEPVAATTGYICPKCHQPGKKHHYFNVCESCNQAAIDHRNARAKATREAKGKQALAAKPAVEVAPAPVVEASPPPAPVAEIAPETTPATPAARLSGFLESSERLVIAISDGKSKFAAARRFDVYRETATGMYFPRGIGRYGQLEGMRPVLRLQQLGTGEWRGTPLTAIGSEVGS